MSLRPACAYLERHCLKNKKQNPNHGEASLAGSIHPAHRPGMRGLRMEVLGPASSRLSPPRRSSCRDLSITLCQNASV